MRRKHCKVCGRLAHSVVLTAYGLCEACHKHITKTLDRIWATPATRTAMDEDERQDYLMNEQQNTLPNTMQPLQKLTAMAGGQIVICSGDDLDLMMHYDISNVIRSRPNPNQVGFKDRWECWIEFRDMKRFETLPFKTKP